jgi:hypothetical protein
LTFSNTTLTYLLDIICLLGGRHESPNASAQNAFHSAASAQYPNFPPSANTDSAYATSRAFLLR